MNEQPADVERELGRLRYAVDELGARLHAVAVLLAVVPTVVLAALTILCLVVAVVAALATAARRSAIPAASGAAALLVVWLALTFVVGAADGGGFIGELGVDATAGAWWPAATGLWTGVGAWLVGGAQR